MDQLVEDATYLIATTFNPDFIAIYDKENESKPHEIIRDFNEWNTGSDDYRVSIIGDMVRKVSSEHPDISDPGDLSTLCIGIMKKRRYDRCHMNIEFLKLMLSDIGDRTDEIKDAVENETDIEKVRSVLKKELKKLYDQCVKKGIQVDPLLHEHVVGDIRL